VLAAVLLIPEKKKQYNMLQYLGCITIDYARTSRVGCCTVNPGEKITIVHVLDYSIYAFFLVFSSISVLIDGVLAWATKSLNPVVLLLIVRAIVVSLPWASVHVTVAVEVAMEFMLVLEGAVVPFVNKVPLR